MNNKLLLLIKKHTDTLIEKTKTKPQETLEFKMDKQMKTVSFNPPINMNEERKCLQAVTSFEATNSFFNITNEKSSFSFSTPVHWNSEDAEEVIEKLYVLLELRSENDIELCVEEVEKRGLPIEKDNSGYN